MSATYQNISNLTSLKLGKVRRQSFALEYGLERFANKSLMNCLMVQCLFGEVFAVDQQAITLIGCKVDVKCERQFKRWKVQTDLNGKTNQILMVQGLKHKNSYRQELDSSGNASFVKTETNPPQRQESLMNDLIVRGATSRHSGTKAIDCITLAPLSPHNQCCCIDSRYCPKFFQLCLLVQKIRSANP